MGVTSAVGSAAPLLYTTSVSPTTKSRLWQELASERGAAELGWSVSREPGTPGKIRLGTAAHWCRLPRTRGRVAPKLLSYALAGFESYEAEQRVTIHPEITFLAGRNNVGKSAMLRALYAFAKPDPDIRAHPNFRVTYRWSVRSDDLAARLGQHQESVARLLSPHPECTLRATFTTLPFNVSLERHPGTVIAIEELGATARAAEANPAAGVAWGGGEFLPSNQGVAELVAFATQAAAAVNFIGPRQVFRGRQQLYAQPQLEPDGRNLTQVVYHLSVNHPVTHFRRLVEVINESFPEIETLAVEVPADGSTQNQGEVVVHYSGRPDRPVPLRFCGSGVEQMLALTVGILTASEPRTFLIDEPQAYLHPHAERSLLALFERYSQHQYVIATHSALLLNARALDQSRLVTMEAGQTLVVAPTAAEELLDEIGIRASDLWLADRFLWVEGPSEVGAFEALMEREMSPAERATTAVRQMPGSSRFSARSSKQATATYLFCASVVSAISPLPVAMRFLFDKDEKTPEVISAIEQNSGNRAVFLPVRELENLFLDAEFLEIAIRARCEDLELDVPSGGEVASRLTSLLADVDNRDLYVKPPSSEETRLAEVRASRVLNQLYYEFTQSEYRKATDGRALAELALEHARQLLEPLRVVLRSLKADEKRAAEQIQT